MSAKISSKYTLFVALVGVGLLAAACSSPTSAPQPVIAPPTAVPVTTAAVTVAPVTTLPALPEGTATPMVASTSAPTAMAELPTPTTIPIQGPTAYTIGTPQTEPGVSVFPKKIQFESQFGANQPKAGDQFAVITFDIANTSKTDSFSFDPAKIVVLEPSGKTESMAALQPATDELAAQTIKPGAKVDGVIVFDVPQNVSKWLLEFEGANKDNLLWSLG